MKKAPRELITLALGASIYPRPVGTVFRRGLRLRVMAFRQM